MRFPEPWVAVVTEIEVRGAAVEAVKSPGTTTGPRSKLRLPLVRMASPS
jgi:hypothetical protein